MKKQNKYINVENFQQPQYPFTFILGARGVGKTFSSVVQKTKENYNNDTMFIYLRRSQTEIDTLNFPLRKLSRVANLKLTLDYLGEGRGRMKCIFANGKPVMLLLALSTVAKIKSNDFSDVTEIVYDEFIDPRGKELKNETKLFLNFAMTVFRDFSQFKVLFLANATNLYNCYFLDFEVMPNKRITKFAKLGIKIVMYQTTEQLSEEHANSFLGKLVEQVEGENGSSLHNQFDNAYNDFIVKLSKKAKYFCTVRLNGNLYGLYKDKGNIIVTQKVDSDFKLKYALTVGDVGDNFPQINYNFIQQLVASFKQLKLYFTDVKSRSLWIKYIKRPYATD